MSVAFCWTPDRPRDGDWHLLALDVGQASSILIMTSQQAMLFDAGGRSASGDDGQRIVLPLLRALGIHTLDGIVISHEDRDHVGGLSSILAAVNVDKLVGVNNLRSIDSKSGVLSRIPCQRGLKWVMDGVRFEVLHPEADPSHATVPPIKGKRNHLSCVLIVTGRYHSVLLPGDITVREEAKLLANGAPRADVVLAPHHGSDTSSSLPWVRATGAQQVIIQSGWRNRFGHPSQHVVARWQGAGARVWRTDQHGAIWVSSQKTGLHIRSTRKTRRRYWHFED